MFQEPKILPWLARKAGVPFAEAREIWRGIASQSAAERGAKGDLAWRQIRELRRQLEEKGRDTRAAEHASDVEWMFPLPLYRTWAGVAVAGWLAWARATRSAQPSLSCPPAVGS